MIYPFAYTWECIINNKLHVIDSWNINYVFGVYSVSSGVRLRKVLGGGMRQCGILAAGAMFALDGCRDRMRLDHQHARMFAQGKSYFS